MRQSRLFLILFMVFALTPFWVPLLGWGFESHELINKEAVKLLPGEIGVYFSHHSSYLSEHAIDPDLWRNDPENHPNEGPGHYIDADLYDDYPFTNIPHSWERLVKEFGEEKVNRWGIAPWRIDRFFNQLVKEFRNGQWKSAKLTAAALGHYVSDIHMPLHVVENYNGQLSDNEGVHKRWEADMVNLYLLNNINPDDPLVPIDDPVEMAFKIVRESYSQHRLLLRADSLARKGMSFQERRIISDWEASIEGMGYLEILYKESGDLAKERLEMAVTRVASFWYSAWIKAGQPIPPQN